MGMGGKEVPFGWLRRPRSGIWDVRLVGEVNVKILMSTDDSWGECL